MKNKVAKESRFYNFAYGIIFVVFHVLYRVKIVGRENIPDGAAVVCSQHSSLLDPLFVSLAMGKRIHVRYMAKKELFTDGLLGKIVRGLGAFPVDRSTNDVSAIKNAFKHLKAGNKVGIFPEGTRSDSDNAVSAKAGAVRIAEKAGVNVVPVYLQRNKKVFSKVHIVIGKPFIVNPDNVRFTSEDYTRRADDLMRVIESLGESA